VVWVDDMACGFNNMDEFIKLTAHIAKQIKIKIMELDQFVGIEITRDRKARSVTLSQTQYVEALTKKHLNLPEIKPWKHHTPSGTSKEEAAKFMAMSGANTDAEARSMISKGYLTMLGALLWAACMTMPDLMFHTSHLARFMQSPSTSTHAYESLVDLLKYTYCRRNIGLTFGGKGRDSPVPFAQVGMPEVWGDASYGGSTVMPYGGGFIRWRNAAVAWISRKLKFVPLSTCEAEVAALVNILKEAMFVVEILRDMGNSIDDKLPCITDSKSAADVVKNPGVTKHTAHFERWLHWARELFLNRVIDIYLTSTDHMMADDKTKVVDRNKCLKCRQFQTNG
jgi:hypothetical protein